uniref:Uncharacterized protein n=1 Tax=Arundo donax TaxID=35708 RepID=A0A0A8ZGJ1_ARUDO
MCSWRFLCGESFQHPGNRRGLRTIGRCYQDSSPKTPALQNVMVYLATTNKESNENYLGLAQGRSQA